MAQHSNQLKSPLGLGFLAGGAGSTECKILRLHLNLHRPQLAMPVILLPKVKLALFRQHSINCLILSFRRSVEVRKWTMMKVAMTPLLRRRTLTAVLQSLQCFLVSTRAYLSTIMHNFGLISTKSCGQIPWKNVEKLFL